MRTLFLGIIIFLTMFLSAEVIVISSEIDNELNVTSNDIENTQVIFNLSTIQQDGIKVNGKDYSTLHFTDGHQSISKGEPQIPFTVSSIIIPDNKDMELKIVNSVYKEYKMDIAPSKGLINYNENYNDIPYTFGDVYNHDKFYPGTLVTQGKPYILRDMRGIDCKINPVQYNPVTHVVRIYSEIEFKLTAGLDAEENILASRSASQKRTFNSIYQRHFDNFTDIATLERYVEISDTPGKLLIVCYDDFAIEMEPYINWKRQKGIETELVNISEVADTGNELLDYLESYYASDNELVWVLLVGDYQQVPVLYSYGTYAGDGFFGRVAGNDQYPDIIIGRFSAETPEHVATQVERTIYHERDITGGDWLNKAAGCAYDGMGAGMHNEGGEEHLGYIQEDLLAYGYESVDEIYEGNGASTQMLANALNEGRGIMNYIGHGDITFYYSIPFDYSDVNALENNNMLPIIHNCACLVGHFAGNDCFSEAWLRAENDDGPIGAVAFLGSAESQWIGVPEYGQDEFVDLLCEEACRTVGGLWFNSTSYAMEVTSEFSQLATWNLFGDPSLCVRSKEPEYMTVEHYPQILIGMSEFAVDAGCVDALVCLSRDDEIQARGFTGANGAVTLDTSNLEPVPGFLTLTITALNKVAYTAEVQLIPADGPFLYIDEFEILSGDDTLLEAGETVMMGLQICNYGSEQASEVELELSIDHELVSIIDAEGYIEQLEPDEMIRLDDVFSFDLDETIGMGCPIQANVSINSLEDSWQKTIWMCTDAPAGLWLNPGVIEIELTPGDSALKGVSILNNTDETKEFSIRLDVARERSIEGSWVECNTENFLPGQNQRWDFTAFNGSIDSEWVSNIILDFPDAVEVTQIEPFTGATGGDMETEAVPGVGILIDWLGVSPNGWGFLHNGESAVTTIDFIVNDLSADSLYVDWQMTGDGYGADPHEVTGRLNFINPLSWIELHSIQKVIPSGDFQVFEFDIDTAGLEEGEYSCELIFSDGEEEFSVPVELNVEQLDMTENDIQKIKPFNLSTYPNPFNPQVNISYQINEDGHYVITAYNIKGQKMGTLLDNYRQKGDYNISWDASKFSSGMYFISMKGASKTETRKVILLK